MRSVYMRCASAVGVVCLHCLAATRRCARFLSSSVSPASSSVACTSLGDIVYTVLDLSRSIDLFRISNSCRYLSEII